MRAKHRLIASLLLERDSSDSEASSREAYVEGERVDRILEEFTAEDKREEFECQEILRREWLQSDEAAKIDEVERDNETLSHQVLSSENVPEVCEQEVSRRVRQRELDIQVEPVSGQKKRVRATSP
jgi:hypothetical protein